MFMMIARYRVPLPEQPAFVQESSRWLREHPAHGRGRTRFLRHRTAPEYLDVLTEWKDEAAFLHAIKEGTPRLTTPHETCERYLYDTLAPEFPTAQLSTGRKKLAHPARRKKE